MDFDRALAPLLKAAKDGDGDGWINEGKPNRQFVGKKPKRAPRLTGELERREEGGRRSAAHERAQAADAKIARLEARLEREERESTRDALIAEIARVKRSRDKNADAAAPKPGPATARRRQAANNLREAAHRARGTSAEDAARIRRQRQRHQEAADLHERMRARREGARRPTKSYDGKPGPELGVGDQVSASYLGSKFRVKGFDARGGVDLEWIGEDGPAFKKGEVVRGVNPGQITRK